MSAVRIRRFTNPDSLRQLDQGLLRQLLKPHSTFLKKRGISLDARTTCDIDALASVLQRDMESMPPDLAEALWLIDAVSADSFHPALCEAAMRAGHLRIEDASTIELAVLLYLHDPEMLRRVHMERAIERRTSFTVVAPIGEATPRDELPTDHSLAAFEKDLAKLFGRCGLGRAAKVHAMKVDSRLRFIIRRGGVMQRQPTHTPHGKFETLVFRPVQYDVVLYDTTNGFLSVNTERRREVRLYCQEFQRLLTGDQVVYDPDSPGGGLTLRPLIERGRNCLNCESIPGVVRIRLVSATVESDDDLGSKQTTEASDVFEWLERRGESLPKYGAITRATLEITIAGEHADVVETVKVLLPDKLRHDRTKDVPHIQEVLVAAGILPGTRTEVAHAPRGLFSVP